MSAGYTVYQWEGGPIINLEKWAADRGEQMVDIRYDNRETHSRVSYSTPWRRIRARFKRPVMETVTTHFIRVESVPEAFYNSRRVMPREAGFLSAVRRPPRPC